VAIARAEGAGAVARHFELLKICDAASDYADPSVWAPIRADAPRRRSDISDPMAYREQIIVRGREIIDRGPSNESEIVAFTVTPSLPQDGGPGRRRPPRRPKLTPSPPRSSTDGAAADFGDSLASKR